MNLILLSTLLLVLVQDITIVSNYFCLHYDWRIVLALFTIINIGIAFIAIAQSGKRSTIRGFNLLVFYTVITLFNCIISFYVMVYFFAPNILKK